MVTTLTRDSTDQFLNSLSENGASLETLRAYKSDLNSFQTHLLPACLNISMETEWIESQAADWLNQHRSTLSAATTRRRKATLSAWAASTGVAGFLTKYKLPPQAEAKPHPLTGGKDSLQKMIDVADVADKALIALCGFGGMRITSARLLTTADVDTKSMCINFTGKGSKENIVWLSDNCWKYLQPVYQLAVDFMHEYGDYTPRRLFAHGDRGASAMITAAGERAGLGHVKSHDLRATFATAAYNASGDVVAVQRLLGHASVTTTQTYVGIQPEAMRKVVNF